jgi:hypothetical protein
MPTAMPVNSLDPSSRPAKVAGWRRWLPKPLRQTRWRSLTSPFWWLKLAHPWSGFLVLGLWWLLDRDRRLLHQVRLQRLFFDRVNFRDVEMSLTDFIRPELWLL